VTRRSELTLCGAEPYRVKAWQRLCLVAIEPPPMVVVHSLVGVVPVQHLAPATHVWSSQ